MAVVDGETALRTCAWRLASRVTFKMALAGLVGAPSLALFCLCRPLWRQFAKFSNARQRKRGTHRSLQKAYSGELLLLYEAGGSWKEAEILLNNIEDKAFCRRMVRGFCQMYLKTGKLDDALLAAKSWAREPTEWVHANSEAARQALVYARESVFWHITPGTRQFTSEPAERMANTDKVTELTGGQLREYRDSRATVLLTEHLLRRSRSGRQGKIKRSIVAPDMRHVPLHRWFPRFNWEFVRELGVSESKFTEICRQAEEI